LEYSVSTVDYLIGDFISFVQQSGLLENTVIYLFPDHLKMGDPSMFKDTGSRGLFLIANSNSIIHSDEKLYQIDLPKIILKGAGIEHNLKFLTDYISINKDEFIRENLHLLTEINTVGISGPFVPASKIHNKTDVLGHSVSKGNNGKIYTYSKIAIDVNYRIGFKLFGIDMLKTTDGRYVAAIDWAHWSEIFNGESPITHEIFLENPIFGNYTQTDIDSINTWFSDHKDAMLITEPIVEIKN
jgi:hypothetical protein